MLELMYRFAAFTDSLPNPNPDNAFRTVLNYVFTLAGVITVIIIVVAGLQYVLSNGDPQKAAKAKNTIIYALVGLVITLSAFTIVNFVLGRV